MRITPIPENASWPEHAGILMRDYSPLVPNAEVAGALDLVTQLLASENTAEPLVLNIVGEEILLHASTDSDFERVPSVRYSRECLTIALDEGWLVTREDQPPKVTSVGFKEVCLIREGLGWPSVGNPSDS